MKRDLFSDLNESQRMAVESSSRAILINAGPGTGKTKTLTSRIAYLILEKNIDPSTILAITFTKKAAAELKERLQSVLNGKTIPYAGTFHSFAYEMNADKTSEIAEDSIRGEIISSLVKTSEFSGISKQNANRIISLYKSRIQQEASAVGQINSVRNKFVAAYNKRLNQLQLKDYDDILLDFYNSLLHTKTAQLLKNKYQHIFIDEFQDTNKVQYEIIKKLCSSSIFLIGDPHQSIYSFRGAEPEIISHIQQDFPEVEKLTLSTNYRSVKQIIHVSSLLFPKDIHLTSNRSEKGVVYTVNTINEFTEADYIVRKISEYVGGTDLLQAGNFTEHSGRIGFSDVAVLYRNHRVCSVLEERLFNSGIPYQQIGENTPFSDPAIQFLLNCMRGIYNKTGQTTIKFNKYPFIKVQSDIPAILNSFKNITKPSILIQKLVQYFRMSEQYKVGSTLHRNLVQFQNMLSRFDNEPDGLKTALSYIQFLEEHEYYDPSADRVTLITMHASKGLEFKVVFILGFEDGIIPSVKKDSVLDEEKRLLYVAMTRAKDDLYLLRSRSRYKLQTSASRFKSILQGNALMEIEDDASEQIRKRMEKSRIKKSQMKMF